MWLERRRAVSTINFNCYCARLARPITVIVELPGAYSFGLFSLAAGPFGRKTAFGDM